MPFLVQLFLTLRVVLLALALAGWGAWLWAQGDQKQALLCFGLAAIILILSWWWTSHRRSQRLRELIDMALPPAGYERMTDEEAKAAAFELPIALPDAHPSARLIEAWRKRRGSVLLVWGRAKLAADSLSACLFAFARLPAAAPLWVQLRSRGRPEAPAQWLDAYRIIRCSDRTWARLLPRAAEEPLRELFRFHVNWHGAALGARLPAELPLDCLDAAAFQESVAAWERLAEALAEVGELA